MRSGWIGNFVRKLHTPMNIIEQVADAIIVTDLNFGIQTWNKAAEKMYGWPEAETLRRSMTDIVRPQPAQQMTQIIADLLADGRWSGEVVHTHRDNTALDVFTSLSLLRDSAGDPNGIISINHSVSHLKHHEQQKLNLALERERIGMLQIFMGDVAHDIRTPLSALKLSLYLLEKAATPETHQRHLKSLQMQTNRLEKLVDDLFDMSRLDKYSTNEYQVGWLDLNELIGEVITVHGAFAENKTLSVHFEPDPQLPTFLGDAHRLERALTNLYMNALNYTAERGMIAVRTYLRDREINIAFCDNGIGIAPEDLPYIFDRFYRADKARGTTKGGVGVGLTIAKRIIAAHGGRIQVESTPGAGSTFTVQLPLIYGKGT